MKKIALFALLLTIIGCASQYDTKYSKNNYGIDKAPNVYTVQKGDSLFAIAWRFGLDQKQIEAANNLTDPNRIFVGQKLKLANTNNTVADKKSSSKSSSKSSRKSSSKSTAKTTAESNAKNANQSAGSGWVWPIKGKVSREFNAASIGGNGIRIAGAPNQTVNAAEGGVVAYKGNGLNGYGNVIIIKHDNGLLSAYGFLSKTYVKEGQRIKKRQKIGTVGYGSNRELMLHFEVRKNGRPVNPKQYIGSRYHF